MGKSFLSSSWMMRNLNANDVDSLLHVQAVCYGDIFVETKEVFEQRLSCSYHCSIGVVREDASQLQAYLVAYWSNLGKITPLNGPFTPPNTTEQVLYLHDMSVLPVLAGQGIARYLVQQLFNRARQRGIRTAALVSVQNSQSYWARQGFIENNVNDAQQTLNLQTYGKSATYMTCTL